MEQEEEGTKELYSPPQEEELREVVKVRK